MSGIDTAQARIVEEVGTWPGVEVRPHRFGGVEFMVGRREHGHVHGNSLADLAAPVRPRDGQAPAHRRGVGSISR